MTWIKVERPSPDKPEFLSLLQQVRGLYPSEYNSSNQQGESKLPEMVKNDSIVLSHSLIPNVLKHTFSAHAAMMDPNLPLSRREHEMIAAVVSALNRCFY